MGVRIDVFIDKEMHNMARYTGLILLIVSSICIFPMIILSIIRYNLIMIIFWCCLWSILTLLNIRLIHVMRKRILRKIIFTKDTIRVLSNKDRPIYDIENRDIRKIKRVALGIAIPSGGIHGGDHIRPIDSLVICCGEEKIETTPRWSDYSKNRAFLFIENRPGLELLLNRYLPHIKIEEKD